MNRLVALFGFAATATRRRGRKNAALTAGLAAIVALLSSVLFLTQALRAAHLRGATALPELTVQRLEAGRPALIPADALDALAEHRGVARIDPRVWGYIFVPSIAANAVVLDHPTRAGLPLEGRAPTAEHEMVLGPLLSEALGVRVGDRMALPAPGGYRLMNVVGAFRHDAALRAGDLLWTTTADARALLDVPEGRVTDLALSLSAPEEAPVITARIAELLPGARVLEREALARTYALTFDGRGGLVAAMSLPAVLAFLLLAFDRLASLSLVERREIAALKALGWTTRDVLSARMFENALVGFVGAGIGVVLGYVHVFVLGAPGLAQALFGWSEVHPTLALVPSVTLRDVIVLLALTVVPYVTMGLVPAFRAAMRDPHETLRGDG